MVDRQVLGDVGIAVLLALPTAFLARLPANLPQSQPSADVPHAQVMLAERSPLRSRFGFSG